MTAGAGKKSQDLFDRARRRIPGGVNSPVRAFKAVGGVPPFIISGKGARITDVDGNSYLDYVGSYGPLLFGHAPDFIVEAIREAVGRGTCYGAPTELEAELAELVAELVPSIEMVRFVNSGSEATTSAVRLARGVTGRTKILKCAGCFHGSVDSLLVTSGSGVATLGIPDTAGVPKSVAAETIVVEYNDVEGMESAFAKYGHELAAFIVEPIAANMGLVPPKPGYLAKARELTSHHGVLLIFDEVISGFRVSAGGAQELFGVMPDITCLGKIVGGGLPVGAYGGRAWLMENLAPIGPVYQAGTLSGNPLAMTSGLATLREIKKRKTEVYATLEALSSRFVSLLAEMFTEADVPVQIQRVGSLLTPFLASDPIINYPGAKASDTALFARLFHALLKRGVNLPPSQYECMFISTAHTEKDIEETAVVFGEALTEARYWRSGPERDREPKQQLP